MSDAPQCPYRNLIMSSSRWPFISVVLLALIQMRLPPILLACLLCNSSYGAPLAATRLRVEYLSEPLSIDVAAPRFSYATTHTDRGAGQAKYQIVVREMSATTGSAIAVPVWDSGSVSSNETTNIEYRGTTQLKPDSDYIYTVTWTDAKGSVAPAATSSFSTGLLQESDWKGAQFVSANPSMLRSEFTVSGSPTRARLYIMGLGYYKSYLNGEETDNHVLGPFTTFENRLLYDAWDVTPLVKTGCNTLGVLVGAGWYAQSTIHTGDKSVFALLSVTTADGKTVYYPSKVSGGTGELTFASAASPVSAEDIYIGENYDARLEQHGWSSCGFKPAQAWTQAVAATHDPVKAGSSLNARTVQIVVDRIYSVVNVTQPTGDDYVIDFGQNIAGLLKMSVVCPTAGTNILIHAGESLHPDGTVLNQYANSPMITNYTCKGGGDKEGYTTLWTYFGFRFIQVKNYPGVPDESSFEALFAHSDVPQSGSLVTSNHLLNAIQHATRYASLSNLMDVPTDCPQRERRGWLGDAQLSAEMAIHNFDMGAFYTKFLRDIKDSQSFYMKSHGGAIPDCVPFYGHGALPADPAWSAAYPLITQWVSEYYADDRVISEHYDGIKAYMDSQVTQLDASGLLSFAHYGDWCSVATGAKQGAAFKRPSISTFYFTKGLEVLTSFATKLGKTDDMTKYGSLLAKTKSTFQASLYNTTSSHYEDGYPISQIMALQLDVVPSSDVTGVFDYLLQSLQEGKYSHLGNHPTGGIVFTKYFWDVLKAHGRNELGISYMLAKGFPSFNYWLEPSDGGVPATTLWERWQSTAFAPSGSYNHIMYGGFGGWLYAGLGGVTRMPGSRGWASILYAPAMHDSTMVTSASASIDTPKGLAAIAWDANYAGDKGYCGTVAEKQTLKLGCLGGHFTGVSFASFGNPIGESCNFTKGECDASSTVSKVTAACVGKSECELVATTKFFGGGDPCMGTLKNLRVSLNGCDSAHTGLGKVSVTVPTGSVGHVVFPLPSGVTPDKAVIYEGKSGILIWDKGTFLPASEGVLDGVGHTGFALNATAVMFTVGSGAYSFT